MIKIKKNGKLYDLVNTKTKINNSLVNNNYGSVQGEGSLHPIFLPDFDKCLSCIVPSISGETNEELQLENSPVIKDLTNYDNNLNLVNFSFTPEYNGLEYYPFNFLDEGFGIMTQSGAGLVEDHQITITSSVNTDACLVISNKIGTVPAFDIEVSGVPEDCPLYFTNIVNGEYHVVKLSNGIYHIPESIDNGANEYRCFNIVHYANNNLNIKIKMLPKKANGIISRNVPVYRTNFTTWDPNRNNNIHNVVTLNKYQFKILKIGSNTKRLIGYFDTNGNYTDQDRANLQSFKVKIEGINEGNSIDYLSINPDGNYTRTTFSQDGIYELPYSYQFNQDPSTFNQYLTCFVSSQGIIGDCNITVTQLPYTYQETEDAFTIPSHYKTDFSNWRNINNNETLGYVTKVDDYHIKINGGEGMTSYFICDEKIIIPKFKVYIINKQSNVTLCYRYQNGDEYSHIILSNGINKLPESRMDNTTGNTTYFSGFYFTGGTGMLSYPMDIYIIPEYNVGSIPRKGAYDTYTKTVLGIIEPININKGSYVFNTIIDQDGITDRIFLWKDGNGVDYIGETDGDHYEVATYPDISLVRNAEDILDSNTYLYCSNPAMPQLPGSVNIKALVAYSEELTEEQLQQCFNILHQYTDTQD